MTEDGQQVEAGDWFVHAHFGAGRVKGQEVKAIGEQEQSYYELETVVCTLWLPEEKLKDARASGLARPHPFEPNDAVRVRFDRALDLTKVARWLEAAHAHARDRSSSAAALSWMSTPRPQRRQFSTRTGLPSRKATMSSAAS